MLGKSLASDYHTAMVERLTPEKSTVEIVRSPESQFGDKEAITALLERGEAQVLGPIESFYPEIAAHANLVELAKVVEKTETELRASGKIIPVVIRDDERGSELLAIFKPLDGENNDIHHQTHLEKLYPREQAAYLISEHFGFDLVPPTILREIDGRIGSLQLFLPPNEYRAVDEEGESEESWEQIEKCPDFTKIALFDSLIAGVDRHAHNYLVSVGEQSETHLAAIDHGLILNTPLYEEADVRGPLLIKTHDNRTQGPRFTRVPEDLLKALRSGWERKSDLDFAALSSIAPEEIEEMWRRVEETLDTEVIISKYNRLALQNRKTSQP